MKKLTWVAIFGQLHTWSTLMRDDELLAFAKAYGQLITLGLGPRFSHQGKGLGLLLIDQRAGYSGHKRLTRVKNLLIRALTLLLRTARYKAFQPQLPDWQQTILEASSSQELGQCCVNLTRFLFPPGETEPRFTEEK
ncbi:hypothetical protein GO755_33650 [Spirosoma sp. HMF4905]|uniref:Uncharacterized protein n=1 Tax=Spirosoma arboris TaxID=2682092 RepID=A0A7K1SMJ6_9BACT|nr:hypothetical protein [Spirosoma arboris]MVM35020.1 hypothetical protein [Spirosoma arboris]